MDHDIKTEKDDFGVIKSLLVLKRLSFDLIPSKLGI